MHIGLLDSVPKGGNQRRQIMDFIRSLRERPETPGDFTDKDSSLRVRQIKIVGDFAITYWLDAPVRTVMIVDVRPANQ
jgi:mRNA-degrading endonuclease RelE of RelBE toxin-antitoxin system